MINVSLSQPMEIKRAHRPRSPIHVTKPMKSVVTAVQLHPIQTVAIVVGTVTTKSVDPTHLINAASAEEPSTEFVKVLGKMLEDGPAASWYCIARVITLTQMSLLQKTLVLQLQRRAQLKMAVKGTLIGIQIVVADQREQPKRPSALRRG